MSVWSSCSGLYKRRALVEEVASEDEGSTSTVTVMKYEGHYSCKCKCKLASLFFGFVFGCQQNNE